MKPYPCAVLFLALALTLPGLAAVAQPLPTDNLIGNPWFRSSTQPNAGSLEGWANPQNAWGVSRKASNPSPDGATGTAARFAFGAGDGQDHSGEDAYLRTVVAADPNLRTLHFQTWVVALFLEQGTVTIAGGSSAQGPWTNLWQPWASTASGNGLWSQTELVQVEIPTGYPFYRVELHGRYQAGRNQGIKYTGVYFAVSGDGVPPEPLGAPRDLAATALSSSEIELTWDASEIDESGFEIERSDDLGIRFQNIAAPGAGSELFVDSGLAADMEYRYRIRALGVGGPSAWAGPVAVATLPSGGGGSGGASQVFAPSADAFVYSLRPTANYGTDSVLRTKAGQYVSFLAFEIAPGAVESAVLKLTSNATSHVATEVAVTEPLAAAWDEGGITWNSRPQIGATIGSLPPGAATEVVELDITSAAASAALVDGRLTLVLADAGTGQTYFASRDAVVGNPELEVTYAGGGVPTPEPLPHVEIGPSPALLLEVGDTVQLEATWFDAEGQAASLPAGSQWVWTSSNPERVSVDEDGLATVLADDSFTVLMAVASGAERHVPGAASIATGAVVKPALLDLDPAFLQEMTVDPSLGTTYLALTVDRVAATEALLPGDLVTFGTTASIAIESIEALSNGLLLRGEAPPIADVYEHLTIDLDSVALERMAGAYAEAGLGPWDGSPLTIADPAPQLSTSDRNVGTTRATAAPGPEVECQLTLNPRFTPNSQFKIDIKDGKVAALLMYFEGLLGLGMPEKRVKTQLKCFVDVKPRAPLGTIPIYGVASFNIYLYGRTGLDFSLDFGQETDVGELGGPTFEWSTEIEGGLIFDEEGGLRFPGGYSDPELTGSAGIPYVDTLEAATMDLSGGLFIELGVSAKLYPGIVPMDPTGVSDNLVALNFNFLVNRFTIESRSVIPSQVFLGPATPDYVNPSFSESAIWDFFLLKSIDAGELTDAVLGFFGWEGVLTGPIFELDPLNVLTFSRNYNEPELTVSEDPVWIGGFPPYFSLSQLHVDPAEEYFLRRSLVREIWSRGPGETEFSLAWPSDDGLFRPALGDEGDWEFRAVDRPVILPIFPLVSATQPVTVKTAPPVQLTPLEPELRVNLFEVGQLDVEARTWSLSNQTYSLSNDNGPAWLTVEPTGTVTLEPGEVSLHQILVDCTSGVSVPATWIDLTLDVQGDTEYPYPIFVGCEDFSVEPQIVEIQGAVADPPVWLEGELTIGNHTDGDLSWTTDPISTDLPFLVVPAGGTLLAGAEETVTLRIQCTVGGVFEHNFEIVAGLERRAASLRLTCEDTGGISWGDPHMVTHDGAKLEFQAHGEMVLSRAPGAGFEVQTRQAGSDNRVSYNTAAAMRVGSDRVAFYVSPPNGGGPVMVDGTAVIIDDGDTYALAGGGEIARTGSTYLVTWPGSSSYVRVKVAGSWMTVRVHPAASLAGNLEGLLGNYDGDASNDFALRDGTSLPSPPSFAQLYDCATTRCLAYDDPGGWIIRDAAESLFDYELGMGPLDFAPADGEMYPLVQVDIDDFDPTLVGWAQSQCVAAGIADPVLLEACILDLVITGDPELAFEAAEVEAGQAGEVGVETCDGDDNDGDGQIDEGAVCGCFAATDGIRSYQICATPVTRDVARQACSALQGKLDLARISDSAENSAVNSLLPAGFLGYWIGPSDAGQEGTWIWPDGSPVVYANWGVMQPSGGTGENCVEHVKQDASWNDLACTTLRGFVCE